MSASFFATTSSCMARKVSCLAARLVYLFSRSPSLAKRAEITFREIMFVEGDEGGTPTLGGERASACEAVGRDRGGAGGMGKGAAGAGESGALGARRSTRDMEGDFAVGVESPGRCSLEGVGPP